MLFILCISYLGQLSVISLKWVDRPSVDCRFRSAFAANSVKMLKCVIVLYNYINFFLERKITTFWRHLCGKNDFFCVYIVFIYTSCQFLWYFFSVPYNKKRMKNHYCPTKKVQKPTLMIFIFSFFYFLLFKSGANMYTFWSVLQIFRQKKCKKKVMSRLWLGYGSVMARLWLGCISCALSTVSGDIFYFF